MNLIALLYFAVAVAIAPLAAASADASSFEVKVTGSGRPMILIPGLACPGAVWDSTVARFSNQYECHIISIAGFGGTPAQPGEGLLLERVRNELASYIRDHALSQPVLVGHSLGGFVALDLASQYPDLVGALIVVDGAPFLTGLMRPGATAADAKASALSMRQYIDSLNDEAYRQSIRSGAPTRSMVESERDHARVVDWSLASDRATVTQAMTEMLSADLREDLARIQSPALVLVTWVAYKPFVDHDRIESTYREQFARLKRVKLSVTDTARHFIMFDDLQWMFAEFETFLATAPAGATR